jgi:hypothetical protein
MSRQNSIGTSTTGPKRTAEMQADRIVGKEEKNARNFVTDVAFLGIQSGAPHHSFGWDGTTMPPNGGCSMPLRSPVRHSSSPEVSIAPGRFLAHDAAL